MPTDRDTGLSATSAATREAVLDHVDAFNAHDTDRLLTGLHEGIVWATGSDVFRGISELSDVFDEGFWAMRPSLAVQTLVVEGHQAAATLHERLVVDGRPREFDIVVFSRSGTASSERSRCTERAVPNWRREPATAWVGRSRLVRFFQRGVAAHDLVAVPAIAGNWPKCISRSASSRRESRTDRPTRFLVEVAGQAPESVGPPA